MLPQAGRLRRSADFQRVYEQGQKRVTAGFVMIWVDRQDDQLSRFGFVVGKRFGCIAARNRLKRRLRAALRPYWDTIQPGHDIVVIARDGLLQWDATTLQAQTRQTLESLKLLNP